VRYKRVLVTGAGGVLGTAMKAIVDAGSAEFVFVTRSDFDLCDPVQTRHLIAEIVPDAVIHLAALSGGVALSRCRPATQLRDNVLMTINVLEASLQIPVAKVVMTLSSGMYPPTAPQPIREEMIHSGPPHESNYAYALAKRLIEPAVRAYRHEHRLNVVGLVPNGIFGEGDDFSLESASMPAALIRRLFEQRNGSEPIVVWGDGSPLRELTYSRDMARAFLWCLEHYDLGQILNVGTPEEVSVRDVAHAIASVLSIDCRRVVFDRTKPSGVPRKKTDVSRFVSMSGFGFTSFRQALPQVVEWFAQNYEAIIRQES